MSIDQTGNYLNTLSINCVTDGLLQAIMSMAMRPSDSPVFELFTPAPSDNDRNFPSFRSSMSPVRKKGLNHCLEVSLTFNHIHLFRNIDNLLYPLFS